MTVDGPHQEVLKKKTQDFDLNELPHALEIAEKLVQALKPQQPAAGLAASQIGISRSIFIYSFDRDPKNLEVVINPSYTPVGERKIEGWEKCLSVIMSKGVWKFAKLSRYESIKVSYINCNGAKVHKELNGFAAKVFQHEYDHLQGIVNIYRIDAVTKEFSSQEELINFMQAIKREDSNQYQKPK